MNRSIIITGTSYGLGKSLLDILKNTEDIKIAISRSYSNGVDIKNKIYYKYMDLSKFTEFENPILKTSNEIVFINNAITIDPISNIVQLKKSDIDYAVRVNLLAPIFITNILLNKKNPSAFLKVINITTTSAEIPGLSLYSSTKKAIIEFFNTLAKEDEKVKISHIFPGIINTPLQNKLRNKNITDSKELFMRYKTDNLLKSSDEVAKKILIKENLI